MPRHDVRRRLATVLFLDIVGSTALASELGDARWSELLTRFRRLVREELKRHGGREQDTAGGERAMPHGGEFGCRRSGHPQYAVAQRIQAAVGHQAMELAVGQAEHATLAPVHQAALAPGQRHPPLVPHAAHGRLLG